MSAQTNLSRKDFEHLLRLITDSPEIDPAYMAEVEAIAERNGYYFDEAGALCARLNAGRAQS